MYIKKLEIFGFKSFANRVELELGPWLTAIVGPNGSGKSNIADAIRWALGADSARLIRGTRMEDVIFAGSDGRKGLGIAEVTVILDNTPGRVPIDFSEIAITRRVYRSGESEYFINKIPCKLRDIQRLLAGTGLGRDGYSVVEQGKIDAILSSRPEDRRAFFEEACGIARSRLKRSEAAKRLGEVKVSLTRILDILGEIERQLGPLASKAEAANRFARYKAELDSLEISMYADSLIRAVEAYEASLARARELRDAALATEAGLQEARECREAARQELETLGQRRESLQRELVDTSSALERAAGDMRIYEERLHSFRESLSNLEAALDENRRKYDAVLLELNACRERIKAASSRLEQEEKALGLLEAGRARLMDAISDLSARKEAAKTDVIEVLSRISEIKNDLMAIKAARESLHRTYDRASQEYSRLSAERSSLESEASSLGESCARLKGELDEIENALVNARSLEEQEAGRKAAFGARRQSVLSDIAAMKSEIKVLRDAIARYDSYSAGARTVLALAARGTLTGIVGPVGEILRVKEGYEAAIEAALGRAVENIVVASAENAREAIDYLRSHSAGRATFLPLDLVRPQALSGHDLSALDIPGIIACASSLVDCREEHACIRDYLLGRVLVARDLNAAIACARHTGSRLKIVTLDGDVIHAGGAISGGHTKTGAEGIFHRQRALKVRLSEMARREQSLKELEAEERDITARLDSVRSRISVLEARRGQLREEVVRLESRRAQLRRDLERVDRALCALGQELGEGKERSLCEDRREAELTAELEQLVAQRARCEEAVISLTQEESLKQKELSEMDARATEARVEVARLSQEKAGLSDTIRRLEETLKEVSLSIEKAEREAGGLKAKIEETKGKERVAAETYERLSSRTREITTQLQETASALSSCEARVRQVESEYNDLHRELEAIRTKLHESELESTRLKANLSQVEERLLESYGVTRDDAMARGLLQVDRQEVQRRVSRLRAQLEEIGPVDMGAIEEHAALLSRFGALSRDYGDISGAVEWVTKTLDVIDRISAARFRNTFLDIRREFREVFTRLFGGGHADLQLEDPANPLETEIRIVAQPPGKRLETMSLLSGGERALLAISLIFAILKVRPAPVAILDETDAALDEANLRRFAELLRELSARSQFIVVTHRKTTMETAEVIYGVTMEESGISKVISISLQDREAGQEAL
ncbi:MAG TPA: chromosome segregation protein SMC [Firmicutes bacterium]|nr:chromosome segregation protein SMC [Bacillota bacterium]